MFVMFIAESTHSSISDFTLAFINKTKTTGSYPMAGGR